MYNGFLNIDKPVGWTSHDVVNFIRKRLEIKKAGHTGTLDPEVSGVLVLCLGKATRAQNFIKNHKKAYRAQMLLGTETDTQDIHGSIISQNNDLPDENKIIKAFTDLKGVHMQIPPMFSAVKKDGKKLYELARQGKSADIPPKEIEIFEININRIKDKKIIDFDIVCSKGTYIRTICHDTGKLLGCGGCMLSLARTMSGDFYIRDSITPDEAVSLHKNNMLYEKIVPAEKLIKGLKELFLKSESLENKFLHGALLKICELNIEDTQIKVYNEKGLFLGIGEALQSNEGIFLKAKKLFI